jgi:hypothetical protein
MVNDKTLSLNDGKVYRNGKELDEYEFSYLSLMANNETWRLYNKGIKRRKIGNGFLIAYGAGIGAGIITGAIICGVAPASIGENLGVGLGMLAGAGAGAGITVFFGSPILVTGMILKSNGKSKIRESVEMYNNGGKVSNAELKFGFTQNGVGVALNF